MSNIIGIAARHNILPYTPKESKPFSGQRLIVVKYNETKNAKEKEDKLPNVCVSVPHISPAKVLEDHIIRALLPHIGTLLEKTQKDIVTSLYETSAGQLTSVSDDEISVEQCISYLNAASVGMGHLKKESVSSWFTDNMRELLVYVLSAHAGFDPENLSAEQEKEITKNCKEYQDRLAGLAGKNVTYTPGMQKSLMRALELCEMHTDKEMGERLYKKLEGMNKEEKKESPMMML